MKKEYNRRLKLSLITQIMIGLACGITFAWLSKNYAIAAGILGELFINALKAIAPILVLMLILTSISNYHKKKNSNIRQIIILYLLSTFTASIIALIASYLAPQNLILKTSTINVTTPPASIFEILHGFVISMITNLIEALMTANYISILIWGIGLGFAFRNSSDHTRAFLNDISQAITKLVCIIMKFAPIGIFGLISSSLASTGFHIVWQYANLISLLIGCMLVIALLLNPILVWWHIRRNPYPLVFTCLRESGITAFFTRSSVANIPVNMALAKKLGLSQNTYKASIPIGANISMAGASITITVMTLAALHTLHMNLHISSAMLLSIVASICACGASAIAGGSLLLIPLVCHMFGIPHEVAMQVIGIGFIISILQDSAETALNSSAGILFTAAVCIAEENQRERRIQFSTTVSPFLDKQDIHKRKNY
ncbi:serine/threonine transporter SstT [Candidatus Erwinia haradaeae]|uniref:Serine/threonine transporter SstT n=1 Tax=Candidatus Erwinia haradaeae TaxID=1922217 RepID=A0A451DNN5_9GAMM|nr:serine/threonine transporter SstT [Candidatus Erwinia haradaeae]VFP88402.1 Serine/threonine transporter SstT [Candidatus Erwinia haradaeae]